MPRWGYSDSQRFQSVCFVNPNKSKQPYCALQGKTGFPSARKFERARGLHAGAELHSAEVLAEAQNARRVHTQAVLSYFKSGGSD
ncbi:hypothetical protein AOLI_G00114580 [Acnodon oligacanthus]